MSLITPTEELLLEQEKKLINKLKSNPDFIELMKVQYLLKRYKRLDVEMKYDENATISDIKRVNRSESKSVEHVQDVRKTNSDKTQEKSIDSKTKNESKSTEFPTSGKRLRGRQIEFIVRQNGKAMSKTDMEDTLEFKTGKQVKSSREALKRAINQGALVYVLFNNSRKYSFIALPEWIDESFGKKMLKSDYSPPKDQLPKNMKLDEQTIVEKI